MKLHRGPRKPSDGTDHHWYDHFYKSRSMGFLLRNENAANILYSHHLEYPGHNQLQAESSQQQCGPYRQPNAEVFCRSARKHHTQSGTETHADRTIWIKGKPINVCETKQKWPNSKCDCNAKQICRCHKAKIKLHNKWK